jgi:hypothetical protein
MEINSVVSIDRENTTYLLLFVSSESDYRTGGPNWTGSAVENQLQSARYFRSYHRLASPMKQ